jgi:L-ribulose-5-phosphate 4-epimerase
MNSPYRDLKEIACRANLQIAEERLAIATFGNASAFDPGRGVCAIKPSGVPYRDLSPETMVVVDLENRVVEGGLKPSSDTPTHTLLYRHFPGLGGVCHTHSPFAVAWAQAMRPIPVLGTTHADHLTVAVPCTAAMGEEAVRGDYEVETGRQILEAFGGLDPTEVGMVLVAGHGPFTWGKDALEAVYHSLVLEELARMAAWTLLLRPDAPELARALREKHYFRKHGKNATYGQPDAARRGGTP